MKSGALVVCSPDLWEERGGPGETRGLAAGLRESPSRVNGGLFPSNSHSTLSMLLTYLDLPPPQAGGRSLEAGSLPRTPQPSLPLLKHCLFASVGLASMLPLASHFSRQESAFTVSDFLSS